MTPIGVGGRGDHDSGTVRLEIELDPTILFHVPGLDTVNIFGQPEPVVVTFACGDPGGCLQQFTQLLTPKLKSGFVIAVQHNDPGG